jgi:exonuclease VII small subunit
MNQTESRLMTAERHVERFEKSVARQTAIVKELEAGAAPNAAKQARDQLETLKVILELARNQLRLEQSAPDKKR